jgi:hypothetical protein
MHQRPTALLSIPAISVPARTVTVIVAGAIALCGMLLPAWASAAGTGSISGVVTDASISTHPGIEGAQVCATPTNGNTTTTTCSASQSDGKYTIPGLEEAQYNIEFTGRVCRGESCELEYVKQIHSAPVKSGETTENVNAELMEIAGKISGRVTAAGAPVSEIDVCTIGLGSGGCGQTNALGEYTIEHILPGSYKILFRPHVTCEIICQPASDYVFQYWNDQSTLEAAGTVVVKESETTTGVNAELQLGGHISGRVTTASIASQPIANLVVCASPTATNKRGERERVGTEVGQEASTCALTNADGEYTISALASGGYEVEFRGEICIKEPLGVTCTHPYISQFYQSIVSVTAPGTTTGINASLLEVSPTKPTNTGAPVVTGTAAVGKALTCSQGSWANNPTSLTYHWLRNGVAIPNQTTNTYKVQNADSGNGVACEVTASNAAGATIAISNTITIPKPPPGKVVVLGASVTGGTVSVKLGCTGVSACSGVMRILARVTTGRGRHKRTRSTTIGLASFVLGLGKRERFRVYLTSQGRKLIGRAGKRGLRVQITGINVQAHTAVLREPVKRR